MGRNIYLPKLPLAVERISYYLERGEGFEHEATSTVSPTGYIDEPVFEYRRMALLIRWWLLLPYCMASGKKCILGYIICLPQPPPNIPTSGRRLLLPYFTHMTA